ncbi:DNA topoisomerase III [Vagococcus lutrae]|uniref:DNA topoisomerase 3 n=1 Tax=Vagococcus lutrae TaxID=81947 RepID=UPI001929453E|nr:DNA topoisomerase 3 [Vagococcus lutrae]UQF71653.1 DNA topoisomerase 3 [Vagococcus lutrae]GEQ61682.1 DNA topoisomerase III [Vagococcus lutrae]GEQ63189.1 DNA topoisomerase III [Vagococcus lutrae]GEQ65081.1 DNA topoisomerase III [Vagococcus lutrae]
MKLVIAEKPSVALSIAKVIGASQRRDGYFKGNNYLVSWCVGHLVQMVNPDKYDNKYTKWRLKDLPIFPDDYLYELKPKTKKQFNILKKLMADKQVDTLVNACDAGREGESIFRLVYNQAKCTKPIQRLWISSMEDQAIKDGFNNLKDGSDYENLFDSAQARSIADWLVGMNLSRLYSCLYNQNYSVGRVQTPTLNMIVQRDSEIESFIKEKYYTVEIMSEGITLSTERIDNYDVADQLKNLIDEKIVINDVEYKEKRTSPDKPYDLTTLQREANKVFGYSAKKTLDIIQKLYENKLVTYPRTDSRYLTEDMKAMVSGLLGQLEEGYEINKKNFMSIFDNSKVTDHYAIIPTLSASTKDLSDLSNDEKNVYSLIRSKLLMAFTKPLIESTTKVIYEYDGFTFTANGKTILDQGFKKYELKKNESKEKTLPNLSPGEEIKVLDVVIQEKYTKPPQHFTEESLLKAMEKAGTELIDKDIEVECIGLGTPATRAGIIENLIYKDFVVRDKKKLLATHKGAALVAIVSDEFKSDEMTSEWEMKLSEIAKGKLAKNKFIEEIKKLIQETVDIYDKVGK